MEKQDKGRTPQTSETKFQMGVLIDNETGVRTSVKKKKEYGVFGDKSLTRVYEGLQARSDWEVIKDDVELIMQNIQVLEEFKYDLKVNLFGAMHDLKESGCNNTLANVFTDINADINDMKRGLIYSECKIKAYSFGSGATLSMVDIDYSNLAFVGEVVKNWEKVEKEALAKPSSMLYCVYLDILNALRTTQFSNRQYVALTKAMTGLSWSSHGEALRQAIEKISKTLGE